MNKDNQNNPLENIEQNTELALLQGEKIANSVDSLEPIMEGVLLKTDELVNEQKKTNELLKNKEESKQIVADEMTFTLKGLKGDDGKTPTEEELLSIIKPLIPEPIKGDEGYTPKKGVDYFDGEDYLLTEEDKKEIASNIEVPIVEKIIEKTVVEKPITIDKTKIVEVAKYESGETIKEKLEKIKVGLSYDSLSNKPNIEEYIQRIKTASRDYDLSELKDVLISSTPTTGQALIYSTTLNKWVPGSAGSTSPLTTKGDIYTYSTTNARLAVGTNGYILSADSSEVTGLKWIPNSSVNAWSILGNTGTTAGTNFLGTTDDVDLVIKRNSLEQARFIADSLKLTTATGTYTITSGGVTDTIILGVAGATSESKFSTSQTGISMKYLGTTPSLSAGVEANANGLILYNGASGQWLWPALDSSGTQALVSNGSGVLSWASLGTGTVTSVDASGGTTGLTFSGGPVTTSGTLTLGGTLAIANGGTGTATGLPINNLIAATGTNTINNANYAQVWQWNSLTTQTGLGLSSSSNTSGALLSLSSTSTAVTTNTGLLNVSYSGTPSTSSQTTYAIYANNNVVGNTSQTRYGVRGGVSGGTLFAGGGTGVGGLFSSSVTGTSGYGVQGTVSGQLASGAYGVYGSSTATSVAGAYGVYGISTGGGLGYGTYGSASATTGTSYGSYGIATTTLNNSASFGGRFRAVANTSGSSSVSYGVYGEAVTTGTGGTAYGGYFSATEVSANNIAGYFTATGGTNNYGIIVANGSVGIGTTAPTSVLDLRRTAGTGTQIPLFTAVGSAHTALTASTEYVDINFNLARTVQFATGAITTQRAMRIQAPTYGFVGASTITNATTFEISGAPVAGTNATITNPLALNVASGNASFGGNIIAAGNTSVIRLKGYTVATLPAGTQGDTAFVTDALAPTFLATIVGGGAVVTPVFYDGANWVGY